MTRAGSATAATTGEVKVLPLYSTLPPAMQQRIFEAAPAPRVPGGPPGRKVPFWGGEGGGSSASSRQLPAPRVPGAPPGRKMLFLGGFLGGMWLVACSRMCN